MEWDDGRHRHWLAAETDRLLHAARASVHPGGGFAWLDGQCQPQLDRPVETWITTRMTHVLSIGLLLGHEECAALVDHGLAALRHRLRDAENGGWFTSTDRSAHDIKRAYDHDFVLLAASSAHIAGRPDARALLQQAIEVFEQHFWDEENGRILDVWNADWTEAEPYLGANANMHGVECFLAVADATGDTRWLDRAVRIAEWFINDHARRNDWRIPEHFSPSGETLFDYNLAQPDHPFRPYGATVGHAFEWSRLLLHLDAALRKRSDEAPSTSPAPSVGLEPWGPTTRPPGWLVTAAKALFARAVTDGWSTDGSSGFVYTTDWDGDAVVRDRLHWVQCEAIAAAAALLDAANDDFYNDYYEQWWSFAIEHFVDPINGSWIHQLDAHNRPASSVWSGKPDVYHAFQACLLPRLPLAPQIAAAVAGGHHLV